MFHIITREWERFQTIFLTSLPAEYVTAFSGLTDAQEVRCDLTDRQTDRTTTVTLAAHARQGLITVQTYLALVALFTLLNLATNWGQSSIISAFSHVGL